MTTLMQSAANNWPEDEASLTYEYWLNIANVDGLEYADAWLAKQRAHMHKVFDDMLDIQRYDAELARLQASD